MKTKNDLAQKIYSLIRSEEGATASDADIALITGMIDPFCATLSFLRVITVPDTDNIDDELFIPLAEYGVEQVCSDFSRAKNPQSEGIAIGKLRLIASTPPTFETMKADYF